MSKSLEKSYDKIKKILEEFPETRNSDPKLYAHLTGCPEIEEILTKTNYETVRRTRAKIFADCPELKPEQITENRKDKEKIFRDFFKSQ